MADMACTPSPAFAAGGLFVHGFLHGSLRAVTGTEDYLYPHVLKQACYILLVMLSLQGVLMFTGKTCHAAEPHPVQSTKLAGKHTAGSALATQRFTHTVATGYGGQLTRAAAAQAAEAMARSGALEQAADWLERRKDVRLLLAGLSKAHPEFTENALPLAAMLFRTKTIGVEEIGDYPEYGARVTVAATALPRISQRIQNALQNIQLLLLHAHTNRELQRPFREFVRLSAQNIATLNTPPPPDALLQPQLREQFSQILNRMHAIHLQTQIINELTPNGWLQPQESLQRVIQIQALAPENQSIRFIRALLLLQLGRTQDTINILDTVLTNTPGFTEALHTRGIAYLRVHLYNLAIADLTSAIQLKPGNPDLFRTRGSVHLTQEYFEGMCGDFFTACTLGICESYHWARSRNLCPEPAATAP